MYSIKNSDRYKTLVSEEVNYIFDKDTGTSLVWGKEFSDDPDYSPYGPFIADIELTTVCNGPNGKLCPFCYKNNSSEGHNMSFETFVQIFNKLPDTLQQIAFGVDAACASNPDTFKIFNFCRENGVIPNVTVADIDKQTANKLANVCGAVAVSCYDDYEVCYNSVKLLYDEKVGGTLRQINIHMLLSEETFDRAMQLIHDVKTDYRLKHIVNAIVFLSLKQTGRGINYTPLSADKFDEVVNCCKMVKIKFGFDSCSAHKYIKTIKGNSKLFKFYNMFIEPCESTRFSIYIDVHGNCSPCSFVSDYNLNILNCDTFIKDIWYNEAIVNFRNKCIELVHNNGNCPMYIV